MQTRLHSDSLSYASLVKSIELYITRFVVLLQTKTLEKKIYVVERLIEIVPLKKIGSCF